METDIKLEEQDNQELEDGEVIDIIKALIDIYNAIDEIDKAMLGKRKEKQIASWKNRLWNNMDYYIGCLTIQEDDED